MNPPRSQSVTPCMHLLRAPTPDLDGFQLPSFTASREAWEEAFKALRSVPLTWPQIIAGYGESMANNQGVPDILVLRDWCGKHGIIPADVAAEAILVRITPVIEAYAEDPEFGPEAQRKMALRVLRVEDDVLQFVGAGPWTEDC